MVKLLIKNPSARYEDFVLEFDEQQTIEDLKTKLSESYPTNPPPQTQKLIFAGKLQPDQQIVASLLQNVPKNCTNLNLFQSLFNYSSITFQLLFKHFESRLTRQRSFFL